MKKRKISKEEFNARLDLAEKINTKFPYLKGHYKLISNVSIDPMGNEIGSLSVELTSSKLAGEEITMKILLNRYLNTILTEDIRKENEKLRTKIKQYEDKISKWKNKTSNKIISNPIS